MSNCCFLLLLLSFFSTSCLPLYLFQLDSTLVRLVPAATAAPARRRRAATDACAPTDSPANTAKWVSCWLDGWLFTLFRKAACSIQTIEHQPIKSCCSAPDESEATPEQRAKLESKMEAKQPRRDWFWEKKLLRTVCLGEDVKQNCDT